MEESGVGTTTVVSVQAALLVTEGKGEAGIAEMPFSGSAETRVITAGWTANAIDVGTAHSGEVHEPPSLVAAAARITAGATATAIVQ